MKKGLLLINLGTPSHSSPRSVRRYLREFLADKRVITLAAPLRYILLYGIILPFRTKRTARAYQSIWRPNGSPLLVNSLNMLNKIEKKLESDYCVSLGMRYGAPSIETALKKLDQCTNITVLPLYPQYSSATTGSCLEKVLQYFAGKTIIPSIRLVSDFHQHPDYINAEAELIKPFITESDYILFSYHGLPEQQILHGGCNSICKTPCSQNAMLNNPYCYRAQCFKTTQCIANQLNLNENANYSTSFQSRLGKTPWIQPYTDTMLIELAHRGIKRLAIVCPSFVTDCLETLEEIGIRAKNQWLALGGEQLTLIPCLNDNEQWIDAIQHIALG